MLMIVGITYMSRPKRAEGFFNKVLEAAGLWVVEVVVWEKHKGSLHLRPRTLLVEMICSLAFYLAKATGRGRIGKLDNFDWI